MRLLPGVACKPIPSLSQLLGVHEVARRTSLMPPLTRYLVVIATASPVPRSCLVSNNVDAVRSRSDDALSATTQFVATGIAPSTTGYRLVVVCSVPRGP